MTINDVTINDVTINDVTIDDATTVDLTTIDAIASVALVVGALMSLLAGIAVLRFPDTMSRIHAATKPQVLGIMLLMLGVGLRLGSPAVIGMLVLIVVLQFVTAPVSAHLAVRVAFRHAADRDAADRDVADRDVADRDVADRDVADRDVADRDVADRSAADADSAADPVRAAGPDEQPAADGGPLQTGRASSAENPPPQSRDKSNGERRPDR